MIESLEQAVGQVLNSLVYHGYRIVKWSPCNYVNQYKKYCHAFITTEHNLIKEGWYVTFKKEFFLTFSKQFPDITKASLGESLNVEAYQKIVYDYKPDYLLFIHPDAVLYCTTEVFQEYCHKHATIRLQKNQIEDTVSIDIRKLKPLIIYDKILEDYLNNMRDYVEHGKRVIQSQIKYF